MNLTDQKIISYLKKNQPKNRMNHVLGVMRLADKLAIRYRFNRKKIRYAGLLHDLARSWSEKKLIRYVQTHSLKIPNKKLILKHHPLLLHGAVSAHLAQNIFSIHDRKILSAISKHTLGSIKMSLFEKLIYVADLAAPDRKFKERKKLEAMAFKNLHLAFREALKIKMMHVLKTQSWIDPGSVRIWNSDRKMAK